LAIYEEQKMLDDQIARVATQLSGDSRLKSYVNADMPIPRTFRGKGEIKLIVLGQDPTVKNAASLSKIDVVLNLRRKGGLWNYLQRICLNLGLDLSQHVYATNYLKNFFVKPPTQIHDFKVFEEFSHHWLPVLQEELAEFAGLTVIALGQPLLSMLRLEPAMPLVRDYWGYTPQWKQGDKGQFDYLRPSENVLGRAIFPFPHQPSIRKEFYKQRLGDYCDFASKTIRAARTRSSSQTV
jgi:hypothetical protein